MRVFILLPAVLAGLLTLGFTSISATEEPPECAGMSAQTRASYMEMRDGKLVPICPVAPQAAREAADPCRQLGQETRRISRQWALAHEYLKIQRYSHLSVTSRDTHLHHITSSGQATAMVADAERQYPAVLDRMAADDCHDDMPNGVKNGYTDSLLYSMANRGKLSWDRWTQWITP